MEIIWGKILSDDELAWSVLLYIGSERVIEKAILKGLFKGNVLTVWTV